MPQPRRILALCAALLIAISLGGCKSSPLDSFYEGVETPTEAAYTTGLLLGGTATGVATAPLSVPFAIAMTPDQGLFSGETFFMWVHCPGVLVGAPLGATLAAPVFVVESLVRSGSEGWDVINEIFERREADSAGKGESQRTG